MESHAAQRFSPPALPCSPACLIDYIAIPVVASSHVLNINSNKKEMTPVAISQGKILVWCRAQFVSRACVNPLFR